MIDQLKDTLIYILLIAAVITVFIGRYIDTGVIMAVVVINTLVGFFQEFKAEKAMEALKKLAAPESTVIRDGEERQIDSKKLVPGDIVVLTPGNKVPADVRLIQSHQLQINESMLTGESTPIEKSIDPLEEENLALADQKNMAFMGTIIAKGRGRGIVVKTAKETQLGHISKQVSETKKVETPLQKRMKGFSKMIGVLTIGLALLVFIVGWVKGTDVVEMLLFAISLAVSVIPAGLPIAATVAMAIGLNRMAERNALIRKLVAVETLGSCNYICSDKTGTITQNRMSVQKIYANDKFFTLSGEGYSPQGEIRHDNNPVNEDGDLYKLLLAVYLCNDASIYKDKDEWKINGDPTEGALIVAAKKFNIEDKIDKEYQKKDDIPFSSKRKYMATLFQAGEDAVIFVKGAPEKIFSFCGLQEDEGLKEKNSTLTSDGLRVIAAAMRVYEKTSVDDIELEDQATKELQFLGLVGMMDPPKPNVIEALQSTKEAGIETVMITGDHKQTATAIATQIKILEEGDMSVTGKEIDDKGKSFLEENVEKIRVYARVSPDHKIKIVESLLAKGNVVAVTGDGVNDAPALKKASIGISMGITGTDVAKEASEMILRDDNFASIFEAVKVGRVIFDNIRKVAFFLLSSSAGVALTIILTMIFGLPLPFFATQVLWINLVTNGLQDVALAFEPAEKNIAKKPPRDPEENIMNAFILKRLALVGVVIAAGAFPFYLYQLNAGVSQEYARTAAMNLVVFFQFFHTLNARSFEQSVFTMSPFTNKFLFISLSCSVIAQILVVNLPPLHFIFSTTFLSPVTWAETIFIALSIIVVMEIDKLIRRKAS